MVLDKVRKTFMEQVVVPHVFIIDKAGFIILKYSHKGYDIFMREIAVPEDFFIELEMEVCKLKGAKQFLYSVGKDFGWLFNRNCYLYHGTGSEDDLIKYVRGTLTFLNTMYASEMNAKTISRDFIKLFLKDYIICRKNGLGYLMTSGAITGGYNYLTNNLKIEGFQIKCQGRGDNHCILICGEPELIQEKYPDAEIFISKITEFDRNDDEYREMNQIREFDEKFDSLQDMMNIGLFGYRGGLLSQKEHKDERYFPVDCSLIHLLESRAKSFDNAEQILFDTAFNFGYKISRDVKTQNSQLYIRNYFAGLGWGDVKLLKDEKGYYATADYIPWSEALTNYNFPILRGFISGLTSGLLKKKILFTETSHSSIEGFLNVRFSPEMAQ